MLAPGVFLFLSNSGASLIRSLMELQCLLTFQNRLSCAAWGEAQNEEKSTKVALHHLLRLFASLPKSAFSKIDHKPSKELGQAPWHSSYAHFCRTTVVQFQHVRCYIKRTSKLASLDDCSFWKIFIKISAAFPKYTHINTCLMYEARCLVKYLVDRGRGGSVRNRDA